MLPIIWSKESPLYPIFYTTKSILELGVYGTEDAKNILLKARSTLDLEKANLAKLEENKNPFSKFLEPDYQSNLAGIGNEKDRERWEILSRELAQKQELIHRMIKVHFYK